MSNIYFLFLVMQNINKTTFFANFTNPQNDFVP